MARTDAYVAVDVQGYLRKVEYGNAVVGAVSEKLPRVLRMANCVKASESELELICTEWGIKPHDVMSRFKLDEGVITAASAGGWVIKPSGDKIHYRAVAVERIVDTTGAGDVFFAAYVALRHGMGRAVSVECAVSVQEACDSAARKAAQHIEGRFIDENLLKVNRYVS